MEPVHTAVVHIHMRESSDSSELAVIMKKRFPCKYTIHFLSRYKQNAIEGNITLRSSNSLMKVDTNLGLGKNLHRSQKNTEKVTLT